MLDARTRRALRLDDRFAQEPELRRLRLALGDRGIQQQPILDRPGQHRLGDRRASPPLSLLLESSISR